jgi:DUF4097 and DUF4098 domain-containing protein YvlB
MTGRPIPPPRRARRRHAVARLAATAAVAGVLGAASPAGAQTRVERRLPADRDVSLRIYNLVGSVRVVAWDRDTVALTGTLATPRQLAMGGTPGAMKIGVEQREGPNPGPPATLEVHVPRTARVWIKTASAPVTVEGVRGGLDLYTVDGEIVVTGDARELRAESMDGGIAVTGAPAWARLKTAAGDIALHGGGGDIGLTSVSGAVTVSDGVVERARLETVTGAITFAATMVRGGSYDVDSHAGRVELRIPPKLGLDLEAATLHGTIDGPVLAGHERDGDGRKLTLVTGDADARVTVRTFKGPIHLRRP